MQVNEIKSGKLEWIKIDSVENGRTKYKSHLKRFERRKKIESDPPNAVIYLGNGISTNMW